MVLLKAEFEPEGPSRVAWLPAKWWFIIRVVEFEVWKLVLRLERVWDL